MEIEREGERERKTWGSREKEKERERHGDRERRRKLTSIDIFNREAENVPCLETCSLVYGTVEQRMGVCILNVEDLSCCYHMTSYSLICWNAYLRLKIRTIRQGTRKEERLFF